jgi:hypothetical protein
VIVFLYKRRALGSPSRDNFSHGDVDDDFDGVEPVARPDAEADDVVELISTFVVPSELAEELCDPLPDAEVIEYPEDMAAAVVGVALVEVWVCWANAIDEKNTTREDATNLMSLRILHSLLQTSQQINK